MTIAAAQTTYASVESRPGLTSLINTGRGRMTLQTEISSEPTQLVTILDFKGRVLKTWRSPPNLATAVAENPAGVRRWHSEIEVRVRETLEQASRQRARRSSAHSRSLRQPAASVAPDSRPQDLVVAHLFVSAMDAYGRRQLDAASELLQACELLRPDDTRIHAALRRMRHCN